MKLKATSKLKNPSFKILFEIKIRRLVLCGAGLFFVLLILPFAFASAQSGVLMPTGSDNKPDPQKLSLAVMNTDITIDNGRATVKIVQIFDNHTAETLEGKYVFALPQKSMISDFAVWDADQRIPGVMLEKKRANRIYESIKQQAIDPGILQSTDADESASGFSAKITPINTYGTKRLELEYTEDLPIENLVSHFTLPLKPTYGEAQTVGEFNLKIRVLNNFAILPLVQEVTAPYPLQILKSEANDFMGEYHARNLALKNDFAFDYQIDASQNSLAVTAYRAPEFISAYDLRDPQTAEKGNAGFFQATALFADRPVSASKPKQIILLLDTSLSMYGDKLARAAEAADYFLHNLAPQDRFNLILFNDKTTILSPAPLPATPENADKAMDFIKNSYLAGGTDLKNAFEKAIEQAGNFSAAGDASEPQIILISDARPTSGMVREKDLAHIFEGQPRARLFAFALGGDANENLLETLTAQTHGSFDSARETEDIALKLKLFFDKTSAPSLSSLKLTSSNDKNLFDVYGTGNDAFYGSGFSYVGRFRNSGAQTFNFSASSSNGNQITLSKEFTLPELDETHSNLPRLWAQAKVNALIQAMNASGEREDYIEEIIRLSEKYKFVTPYTAFLAAPRALLRPRLIQPGDPVIRVKTDDSVKEITAVLPFGETLPLKFLENEKVWEVRFLAPPWMADGSYKCRLLLTDKNGTGYAEEKTFVVDSRAPHVAINLAKRIFRAGETVNLKVLADSDTNRLTAKLYGAKPAQLAWSNQEKANTGKIQIPETLAPGKYVLSVSAEDFAHNQTTEEIQIEITRS